MSGWVWDGRLSFAAPPPPHKFLGATSAQLPGPRAPCALNWRKKNKKPAPNKEQPVPARPGPVGASQLASLREGRPAGCKRGREHGVGRRLCPEQQQSPLQDPDPSLHPVKRLWPGKCRWGQELGTPLVGLAPSTKGMPQRTPPAQLPIPKRTPEGLGG